jgi:hypothetical protein
METLSLDMETSWALALLTARHPPARTMWRGRYALVLFGFAPPALTFSVADTPRGALQALNPLSLWKAAHDDEQARCRRVAAL